MDTFAAFSARILQAVAATLTWYFTALGAHPVLTLAATGVAVWQFSVWRNPFAKCRRCTGAGRFFGWLARKSWHSCPSCGGSGRRIRLTGSDPAGRGR